MKPLDSIGPRPSAASGRAGPRRERGGAERQGTIIPMRARIIPIRVQIIPMRVQIIPMRVQIIPMRVRTIPMRVRTIPQFASADPACPGVHAKVHCVLRSMRLRFGQHAPTVRGLSTSRYRATGRGYRAVSDAASHGIPQLHGILCRSGLAFGAGAGPGRLSGPPARPRGVERLRLPTQCGRDATLHARHATIGVQRAAYNMQRAAHNIQPDGLATRRGQRQHSQRARPPAC